MPALPRLVALDLDGTTLRRDKTVSPRTQSALRRIERDGALVVFVTGRPSRWLTPLIGVTERAMAICANGAARYDLATDEVSGGRYLDSDALRSVIERLSEAVPDLRFCADYGHSFAHEPGYVNHPDDTAQYPPRVVPCAQLADRPALKLLARHPDLDPDELLALAAVALGDLANATHSSQVGLLEISAAGVSKASALAELAGERGVDQADSLAFGDMPNDLPMLAWAGRSVAVANAHPTVLAAADAVTGSNDDDGVAEYLEDLYRR